MWFDVMSSFDHENLCAWVLSFLREPYERVNTSLASQLCVPRYPRPLINGKELGSGRAGG